MPTTPSMRLTASGAIREIGAARIAVAALLRPDTVSPISVGSSKGVRLQTTFVRQLHCPR